MLLGMQPDLPRRILAEAEKLPQLAAKIRQEPVIAL
jgi:hypothetical protein